PTQNAKQAVPRALDRISSMFWGTRIAPSEARSAICEWVEEKPSSSRLSLRPRRAADRMRTSTRRDARADRSVRDLDQPHERRRQAAACRGRTPSAPSSGQKEQPAGDSGLPIACGTIKEGLTIPRPPEALGRHEDFTFNQ